MREPRSIMQKAMHANLKNGGISFTEEEFIKLYDDVVNDIKVLSDNSTKMMICGIGVGIAGTVLYGKLKKT